jgi:hypothetical protein
VSVAPATAGAGRIQLPDVSLPTGIQRRSVAARLAWRIGLPTRSENATVLAALFAPIPLGVGA